MLVRENNMRKLIALLLIMLSIPFITSCSKDELITLEDEYYESSNFISLSKDNLEKLIKDKENFLVFINYDQSIRSNDFEQELYKVMNEYQITFYKISFFNLEDTVLEKKIDNYPAVAIFNKGKLVTSLLLDGEYNIDDFISWLKEYVSLPDVSTDNTNNILSNYNEIVTINLPDTALEDIKYDKNKVNIYLFWGNGCPHCEDFLDFLEENTDYKDLYTLNTFEVWYNQDNYNLMNEFATALDEDVTGVPFIVIGNKSFKGFSSSLEEEILNAIKEGHSNSYDVYFNDIKN